jgi:hypothetical protein
MNLTIDAEQIADAIEIPVDRWLNRCHEVSLAAVRSGLLGEPGPSCRVVRGFTSGYGIFGQHSWIALGRPFDPDTTIVDLTAQAWHRVEDVVVSTVGMAYAGGNRDARMHVAHGYLPGSIWEFGRPDPGDGAFLELDRTGLLSYEADSFLDTLGPMCASSWIALVTYPHGGWPAHEVCEMIVEQVPRAKVMLPIDVVAHTTDRNPEGLYW